MKEKLKLFYYSIIAALSSFLFGLFLTSESVLYPRLEDNFKLQNFYFGFGVYKSLFASIVFLGAFISSYFVFLVNDLDRKIVLIINNLTYLLGSGLTLFFEDIYILLMSRFIIGLGAGISCCIVPSYVFSITDDRNRGFYMSFHSIGIVLGLVIGKVFCITYTSAAWDSVYTFITLLVIIHTIGLFVIKKCPSSSGEFDHTTIPQLLKNRRAIRSTFLAVCFHIAQHACGIDFFTIFIEEILSQQPDAEIQGAFTLAFSALVSVISCCFIDKVGRKIFMCISTAIVLISTLIMGFGQLKLFICYLYVFGYNIGLSSIPWFITNEIFTPEYCMPAMRLTVGVNWMSAFLLSFINMPLYTMIGSYIFLVNSLFMAVFLVIVVCLFKETKNRPAEFQ
ncbi:hypothetical protein NCER_101601 [Vairimorpha ceranae BRL01]|uniref:Major facilitator superfamily (MFS) profile domain-containing protein n=2 Tax=Vairimorpha ceranae TaxID=40302 RepID=C4VAD6_VAIC1|nr:glucose transporter type 3 [Vairimorpha ceranae]EEQ81815.1 hypothetical protein NCER_101601 [Vairimorpha ceranae BRL01]KAF5141469.1 hypothetical protein G9O61_00g003320 [Vairimorpha ceranae]KKO76202.1 glucose transporter type 3 [Vairimorpha ceranae]